MNQIPSEVSAHDVGPSGHCCICNAPTDRCEDKNLTVFNHPPTGSAIDAANNLAYDSYLVLSISICENCAKKRQQRTAKRMKRAGLGFVGGFALAIAGIAIAGNIDPALIKSQSVTMVAALMPFVTMIAAASWKLPGALPGIDLGRVNATTGLLEGWALPHPENLSRLG